MKRILYLMTVILLWSCVEPAPKHFTHDVLNRMTPVKDQGSFNTCWAFSSLGAIEASSLLNGTLPGETAATLDLSERHLTFFTYNTQPDPLGGTRGDSTAPHNSTYVARGGNDLIATYTLATWMGVVPEGAVGSYDDLLDNDHRKGCDHDLRRCNNKG